jgi:hypothetical protein
MRSRAKPYRNAAKDDTFLRTKGGIPAPLTFYDSDAGVRRRMPTHKFNEGIAQKICEEIMNKRSLTAICKDPAMPSVRTVTRWLADPRLAKFREMYYQARRVQAEMLIDEIFEIADDTKDDWKPTRNKHGKINGYKPDNDAIQRSRVKIDVRKWFASKMVPRMYGEHLDVSHDVTGDLAELLKAASNKDQGLPNRRREKIVNE